MLHNLHDGNKFEDSVPERPNYRANGNNNRGNVPETRKIQSHKHKNGRFVPVINAVYLYLMHIMRNP
jgi:hypothetical protein